MTKQTIEFSCRKKPTTYELKEIKKATDRLTLSQQNQLKTFYEMMGLEFDENIFERIIEEYSLG